MNKIHVTQGHQDAIGLEVFLKSFLLLSKSDQEKFVLHVFLDDLSKNLKLIKLDYQINDSQLKLGTSFLSLQTLGSSHLSKSYQSLISAESSIKSGDILLTLPTSKQELNNGETQYSGHTDYFRKKYNNEFITMLFVSKNINLAILSEHITLGEVELALTPELVFNKVSMLIQSYYSFKEFTFSGINPHCGESGIIGNVDNNIDEAIKRLKSEYPKVSFSGPYSGDTLLMDTRSSQKNTCYIYSYHDQGLAPFKSLSGLRASNVTIGLPFLRLSPDHGTAFDLYGKNKANNIGIFFTMKEAIRILKNHEYR